MRGSLSSALHRAFVAEGFRPNRADDNGLRYEGQLHVLGRAISVAFVFPDADLAALPRLFLMNWRSDAPEVVAHMMPDGQLCYAQPGDVVLDRYDVPGSVRLCIVLAERNIERALTHKHLEGEIAAEFPQHWSGKKAFVDFRKLESGRAWLYRLSRTGTDTDLLLADCDSSLNALVSSESARVEARRSRRPAWVWRIGRDLTFERGQRPPKTLSSFFDWFGFEGGQSRPNILRAIVEPYPQLSSLFIYGTNGCVGIDLKLPPDIKKAAQTISGTSRLLAGNAGRIELFRMFGERIDWDFVFTRNLGSPMPFAGKRIGVIGCGTVGGHLAKFLAQSGAGAGGGSLVLFDDQTLRPGNIGRHFLGLMHVGANKATAMRIELLRLFPENTIVAFGGNALTHVDQLDGFDLIVDATGEEALSLAVNDRYINRRQSTAVPAVLHVWLLGNGAAAQAIFVVDDHHACLKCLKPRHGGQQRLDPLKQGYQTRQMPAACGEAPYLPYGVGAPAIAAGLALEMALDWARGDARPTLRTIRIDSKSTTHVEDRSPTKSDHCPACKTTALPLRNDKSAGAA